MMIPLFRSTTADFRKWCHEYVRLAFQIAKTYEQNPLLVDEGEYKTAQKICRQYKVLLASLDKKERSIFENKKLKAITKEEVGERITKLRKEEGYTRKYVAEIIGISEAALKAYEYRDRMLRLDVAYQLSQLYQIEIDKLIT